MFHPNVYADGGICLDILQNRWSPTYDVSAILTSIQVLIPIKNIHIKYRFIYFTGHLFNVIFDGLMDIGSYLMLKLTITRFLFKIKYYAVYYL